MKQRTHSQHRRDFLKCMAILAGGASLAPVIGVFPALAASSMVQTFEERMLMGTFVSITAVTASRTRGEEAVGRAFEEMGRQIAVFNRFDSMSAVSALNDHGRLDKAPQELIDVVSHSYGLHRQSGGRFDVTVAPVINLLERSQGAPDSKELHETLGLVDANGLRRSGSTLRFDRTGMAATLDGVAKGYIADQAATILQNNGVEHFLINAGGDIRAKGSPQGQERPWKVAIEDPNKEGNYPAVLELSSGAVATSGGYEVFYDSMGKSNHLINPGTGESPQYIKSVSVHAPTVMQADALATALSLMHPREALRLTQTLPGHACLLVTSTGTRLASQGWGTI